LRILIVLLFRQVPSRLSACFIRIVLLVVPVHDDFNQIIDLACSCQFLKGTRIFDLGNKVVSHSPHLGSAFFRQREFKGHPAGSIGMGRTSRISRGRKLGLVS
jgi:hypothetical protein